MMTGTILQLATAGYLIALVLQALALFSDHGTWKLTGLWLTRLAWIAQGAGLVMRWMAAGGMHPPWISAYEALNFSSWVTVGVYLYYGTRQAIQSAGIFVLAIAASALVVAHLTPAPAQAIAPLAPALRSRWIVPHAAFGFLAYGFLFTAAAVALLHLVKDRVRSEVLQLGFSVLALCVLPLAAGKSVFSNARLDFFQVIRDLDGGLVPVNFRMANGEMSAQYVTIPWGGALVIAATAVFGIHLIWAALVATRVPAPKETPAQEATHLRALRWFFGLGAAVLVAIAADLVYSNFQVPGFQIFSNPYRFAAFGLLAVFAVALLGISATRASVEAALPDAAALDRLTFQAVSAGFACLTLTLVSGSIWAYFAWGRYWGWDPKEIWALSAWLVSVIYLHLRVSGGWSPRQSSVAAIIGVPVLLFAFLGVNLLLPSMHVFKG